ncbi:hypothetical protein C8Q79DRAFT_638382 [Trametes meyenii]|nr:hypothetical protein C8Q79DRAFT_638382 [Trametes meyenii]
MGADDILSPTSTVQGELTMADSESPRGSPCEPGDRKEGKVSPEVQVQRRAEYGQNLPPIPVDKMAPSVCAKLAREYCEVRKPLWHMLRKEGYVSAINLGFQMTRDELLKCIDLWGFTGKDSGYPKLSTPRDIRNYGIVRLVGELNADVDSKWKGVLYFSCCITFKDGYAITVFPRAGYGGWQRIETEGRLDEMLAYATAMFEAHTGLQVTPMWHFLPKAFGPEGSLDIPMAKTTRLSTEKWCSFQLPMNSPCRRGVSMPVVLDDDTPYT